MITPTNQMSKSQFGMSCSKRALFRMGMLCLSLLGDVSRVNAAQDHEPRNIKLRMAQLGKAQRKWMASNAAIQEKTANNNLRMEQLRKAQRKWMEIDAAIQDKPANHTSTCGACNGTGQIAGLGDCEFCKQAHIKIQSKRKRFQAAVQNKLASLKWKMAELTKAQRECMRFDAAIQDKLARLKWKMAELTKAQLKCMESDAAIQEKPANIKRFKMAQPDMTETQRKRTELNTEPGVEVTGDTSFVLILMVNGWYHQRDNAEGPPRGWTRWASHREKAECLCQVNFEACWNVGRNWYEKDDGCFIFRHPSFYERGNFFPAVWLIVAPDGSTCYYGPRELSDGPPAEGWRVDIRDSHYDAPAPMLRVVQ